MEINIYLFEFNKNLIQGMNYKIRYQFTTEDRKSKCDKISHVFLK